jgi:hypothetical protein
LEEVLSKRHVPVLAVLVALVALPATADAAKHKKHKKKSSGTLVVCKHGCRFSTIQAAVDASKAGATIRVKPGKYVEGVIVKGHSHDNLHILGNGRKAKDVILEGKNAKGPGGAAQNGVEVNGADNVDLENMWARHYPSNGFFIHGSDDSHPCDSYLMKNLVASFNHSYGLYVFRCKGGRMTQDVGYGHGDSAFYVGGTPVESKPEVTLIDHSVGYENVLGYSGTNSKYMDIRDNEFYNNGAGIVPNTLSSEPDEPASNGVIEENLVYWNNFDYYKPGSPVPTVSSGVGIGSFNYPIGVGVILFGIDGWTVKNNSIFGNFKWGAAEFSDPTNTTGKALNSNNKFQYNLMGAPFGDTNGADFWTDGSGSGNCWLNNSAGSTFDPGTQPNVLLYPTCPQTGGTGGLVGDPSQDSELLAYASQTTGQEDSWSKHKHPARPDRTPIDGMGS